MIGIRAATTASHLMPIRLGRIRGQPKWSAAASWDIYWGYLRVADRHRLPPRRLVTTLGSDSGVRRPQARNWVSISDQDVVGEFSLRLLRLSFSLRSECN